MAVPKHKVEGILGRLPAGKCRDQRLLENAGLLLVVDHFEARYIEVIDSMTDSLTRLLDELVSVFP
jgi:hypothetical protein